MFTVCVSQNNITYQVLALALLLVEGRLMCIGGAQEKEDHFHYLNFKNFELRYHMPYQLDYRKILSLWIRIILGL